MPLNIPGMDTLTGWMPSFGGGSITTWLIIGLFFIVLLLICVTLYFFFIFRMYNKKIVVFENIAGQGWKKTYSDRARLLSLGAGGEELLFLLKKKVYRTAYGRKMGHNLIWFAIGQDGYWYNITLGDLDAKQGQLDIEPVDRDMRHMHVAIRKNIQDRYRKVKWFDKWGIQIINGIFLIIMIFGIWFLISKIGDAGSAMNAGAIANKEAMQTAKEVLSALDNICSGSGIR